MSRLRSQKIGSKIQPEVIDQVHDEVIALCLRTYASVPSLEIDGIICISLLDSKEQQVVKIHKTFKSIVADAAKKSAAARNSAYPNITSILSGGSPASFSDSQREDRSDSEAPNFQKDINTISDLLKASDVIINADNTVKQAKASDSQDNARSKRKRRHPKHRYDFVYDSDNIEQEASQERENDPHNFTSANGENESRNPPTIVTVKEEPVDPDYESSSGPNILHASSEEPESESNKTVYDRDQNVERENRFDGNTTAAETLESSETTVKSENTEQDSEYGIAVGNSCNANVDNAARATVSDQFRETSGDSKESDVSENRAEDVPREWLYPETFDYAALNLAKTKEQKNKGKLDKHWLYGITKEQRAEAPEIFTNEVTKAVMMDKYYQHGSIAHKDKEYPKQVQREEKDPLGRSWIEMVKDNVTKYQAALMRTVNKKQKEEPAPGSASGLLKSLATPRASLLNADHLKALLKTPPLHIEKANLASENDRNPVQNASSSGSEKSRSNSVSPAPVVKIEIDEDPHEMMNAADQTEFSENNIETDKPPSGKLESRYPALFNQLQQAKQPGQPGLDQPDSLVNRLPFISFQELFSQANPAPGSSRMSESATMRLLEQAKVNPYPSKSNTYKKKSVWKWKKRYVKPKDDSGRPLSNISVAPELAKTMANSAELNGNKALGIHMSAKKTFAGKRPKLEENSDHEWIPSAGIDDDVQSGDSLDGVNRKKISTRLSTGEKPRINFAELENSDIEIDEEDIKELDEMSESPIELVSAYCKNTCGARFSSFTELKIHEDNCTWNSGAVGGTVGGAESVGTSDDYKCTICGLDFNQEYRWHYHMVKVHGISADKTALFR